MPNISSPFKALYGFLLYILGYASSSPKTIYDLPDEILLNILARLPNEDLQSACLTAHLLADPGKEITDRESLWQILSQRHLQPWRDMHFKDRANFNYSISSPEGNYIAFLAKIQSIAQLRELGHRQSHRLEPAATFFDTFRNAIEYPFFHQKEKIAELKNKFDSFLLILEYTFLIAKGVQFPPTITLTTIMVHFNASPSTNESRTFWQDLNTELERINTEKLIASLPGSNSRRVQNNENRALSFNKWLSTQKEKELSLSWKDFTRVPQIIELFKAAKSIDFSDNNIISISPKIGELIALEKLNFSGNKLVSLPVEIQKLKALETLNFSSNLISILPEQIWTLNSLKVLYLVNNNITHLSEKIGNLSNLIELHIGINFISNIPYTIEKLQKLNVLMFETNLLITLPKNIGNLANLTTLKLNDNKIKKLPESIGQLIKLEKLFLEGNKLTALPVELKNLLNLKILSLYRNLFESLPSWVNDFRLVVPTGYESVTETLPPTVNRRTPRH